MSDKQDAFVTADCRRVLLGTPHRYCQNHFLRDVAHPVLEMDSRAKVKMRSKVRGLRAIERRVLEDRRHTAVPERPPLHEASTPPKRMRPRPAHRAIWALSGTDSTLEATGLAAVGDLGVADEAGEVVLGYCAAARWDFNDSRGGSITRPGLTHEPRHYRTCATRWSATCKRKRGRAESLVKRLAGCIDHGLDRQPYDLARKLANTSRTCKQWRAP